MCVPVFTAHSTSTGSKIKRKPTNQKQTLHTCFYEWNRIKNKHLKIPYNPLEYCDINLKSHSYFVFSGSFLNMNMVKVRT